MLKSLVDTDAEARLINQIPSGKTWANAAGWVRFTSDGGACKACGTHSRFDSAWWASMFSKSGMLNGIVVPWPDCANHIAVVVELSSLSAYCMTSLSESYAKQLGRDPVTNDRFCAARLAEVDGYFERQQCIHD